MKNREIKFRGKRKDTLEWAYGSYHYCTGPAIIGVRWEEDKKTELNYHWILEFHKPDSQGWTIRDTYFAYSIIPESIGQFTGLKDKNGKEIYEGDVVDRKFRWVVCFEDGSFWVKNEYAKAYLLVDIIRKRKLAGSEMEVIGNIYENPELLIK